MSDPPPEPPPPPIAFPSSIVSTLFVPIAVTMGDYEQLTRPVRSNDPNKSIAIFGDEWVPDLQSMQMGQIEPVESHWNITIQIFIRSVDSEQGVNLVSQDTKILRTILYRSPSLRVALGGLKETIAGTQEIVKRWHITRQKFLGNKIGNEHLFLSVTNLAVYTENLQL